MPSEHFPKKIKVGHRTGGKYMVKESDSEAADINAMVNKWITQGTPVPIMGKEPKYGDFSTGMSYHEAMNRVKEAEQHFADLPTQIRTACQQDVGEYLDKVYDPVEREKLEALGMEPTRAPEAAPDAAEPPAEVPAAEPDPAVTQ